MWQQLTIGIATTAHWWRSISSLLLLVVFSQEVCVAKPTDQPIAVLVVFSKLDFQVPEAKPDLTWAAQQM